MIEEIEREGLQLMHLRNVPTRDVPIKKVFYKTLQTVQGVRKALR